MVEAAGFFKSRPITVNSEKKHTPLRLSLSLSITWDP